MWSIRRLIFDYDDGEYFFINSPSQRVSHSSPMDNLGTINMHRVRPSLIAAINRKLNNEHSPLYSFAFLSSQQDDSSGRAWVLVEFHNSSSESSSTTGEDSPNSGQSGRSTPRSTRSSISGNRRSSTSRSTRPSDSGRRESSRDGSKSCSKAGSRAGSGANSSATSFTSSNWSTQANVGSDSGSDSPYMSGRGTPKSVNNDDSSQGQSK